MLNNISVGKFYNIKSPIHSMHPTSKIICTIIFLILVLVSTSFEIIGILALLTLSIILLAKLPMSLFLNQLYSLRYLVLFLIFVYYLNKYELVELLLLLSKLALIVVYTAILTLTTKSTEITTGLEEFLAPLTLIKIPVSSMALIISLSLRFIPTVMEQAHRILKALAARGIDYYNSGIKTKIKAINILLIPMFLLSLKRSDQLADAMDVRLYRSDSKRSNYNAKKFQFLDFMLIFIHIAIFIAITMKRMGLV